MSEILEHPQANVLVKERSGDRRALQVRLIDKHLVMRWDTCETSYPLDLIKHILDVKGPAYLCDEIMRDQDPLYVQKDLETELLAYFDRSDFDYKRILDFGCGAGASTAILARMFPKSEIVGAELDSSLLSIARKRIQHYGLARVALHQSPSGTELPEGLGEFDFVVLSAVYEHLLPQEREILMPKVWSLIREDGYLFIDQLPNRLFPVEQHTTGLPFINYMPKRLALEAAQRFSRQVGKDEPWEELLRKGIRGATEREILTILRKDRTYSPVLIEPTNLGLRDRIDLWYSVASERRMPSVKLGLKVLMKAIKFATGLELVPYHTLAIKKSVKSLR
jgi:2-polyprenyl-3-methyl-5-hydroxy-6-metoxy-1,4-benzoquinol methylase